MKQTSGLDHYRDRVIPLACDGYDTIDREYDRTIVRTMAACPSQRRASRGKRARTFAVKRELFRTDIRGKAKAALALLLVGGRLLAKRHERVYMRLDLVSHPAPRRLVGPARDVLDSPGRRHTNVGPPSVHTLAVYHAASPSRSRPRPALARRLSSASRS